MEIDEVFDNEVPAASFTQHGNEKRTKRRKHAVKKKTLQGFQQHDAKLFLKGNSNLFKDVSGLSSLAREEC